MTGNSLWVGDTYRHGTEPEGTAHDRNFANVKGISPIQTSHQIGLHMAGGCVLPHPFNGCAKNHTGFCYKPRRLVQQHDTFYLQHYFDEVVHTKDLKIVKKASEGVLLHILLNRVERKASNITRLNDVNDYAAHYFNRTLQALKARRLNLIVETPFIRRLAVPISSRNGL